MLMDMVDGYGKTMQHGFYLQHAKPDPQWRITVRNRFDLDEQNTHLSSALKMQDLRVQKIHKEHKEIHDQRGVSSKQPRLDKELKLAPIYPGPTSFFMGERVYSYRFWKFNIDTKNDGSENVSPLKYDHIWLFWVSMLNFRDVMRCYFTVFFFLHLNGVGLPAKQPLSLVELPVGSLQIQLHCLVAGEKPYLSPRNSERW